MESIEQAKILQDSMGYSQMADHPLKPALDQMHQSNQQLTEMLAQLIAKMHQPKRVIRDENGKIVEEEMKLLTLQKEFDGDAGPRGPSCSGQPLSVTILEAFRDNDVKKVSLRVLIRLFCSFQLSCRL
jgi:hypothetical protein